MASSYEKIARILRASPSALVELDYKMRTLTGQEGVFDDIERENRILTDRTLSEIGLSRKDSAETVHNALIDRLMHLDKELYDLLDHPVLTDGQDACGKLCQAAMKVFTPPAGFFIKKEKMVSLLEKYPPTTLMEHFGYSNVRELFDKEGFVSVVSALRFSQSQEWMHKFFEDAYSQLTQADFEERPVELQILNKKWIKVAEKYVEHKYHNVSHLKELGVIFVIPQDLTIPGETLRLFTLMLHYLHEVPFYSHLIGKFSFEQDFTGKLKSLLRGDVPDGPAPMGNKIIWRIVQRYLAKDNEGDFRLIEPHVNPEADHWFRAEEDMGRLSRMLNKDNDGQPSLGYWTGLDFVGDYFKDNDGKEILVSFDLIDLIMSLVKKGEIKYLYHQQEALWNKIFAEYMGRETMDRLIDENIINGFVELSL